jgi:hypothetical protein
MFKVFLNEIIKVPGPTCKHVSNALSLQNGLNMEIFYLLQGFFILLWNAPLGKSKNVRRSGN